MPTPTLALAPALALALALVLAAACGSSASTKATERSSTPSRVATAPSRAGATPGDADGDGITGVADQCPEQAESKNGIDDDDGCPESDQDLDGLFGSADKCPSDPEDFDGDQDDDGCPDLDADRDGVADSRDMCPSEIETMNGYKDTDGCADEIPASVKKFSGTIDGIAFQTGSAAIRKSSNRVLDAAAAVLTKYPEVAIEIQGHTDNTGRRETNLALSQERAEAVRSYLIGKGVAPERLLARGYGPDEPKAANSTKRGQAKNRRVDFVLISPPTDP